MVCGQKGHLAQKAEIRRAALRRGGPAGEADVMGIRPQMHADEHKVQDVGHAGPGIRLLLQQRGHQCVEVPAVAGRDGRKSPAAGIERTWVVDCQIHRLNQHTWLWNALAILSGNSQCACGTLLGLSERPLKEQSKSSPFKALIDPRKYENSCLALNVVQGRPTS